MKIPHPWKCDSCGALKQPSNNWLIIEVGEGYSATVSAARSHCVSAPMKRIAIWKWDDTLADQPGTKHICGQRCVIDQVAKIFPELGIEKPKVEPESEREIR